MQKNRTVLVIGMNGIGLMPTTPRKARILLRQKKARVEKKMPFTIKLLYKTGCATQQVDLGVDTGSQHIGIAVVSNDTVLQKSEWELRSTMEKRRLIETRSTYRRSRRSRKTPYRHPKFRYHTKREYAEEPVRRHGHRTHWAKTSIGFESNRPAGWLPPSVQSKVDHHAAIISWYQKALPPDIITTLELARFDMQRVKNPDIRGEEYQRGRMYDFENARAYVLAKFNYTCPVCGRKIGSVRPDGSIVKARMHHADYKSNGATDNPDEYWLVCDCDHSAENHRPGGVLDRIRKASKSRRGMRDMTMMNIVAARLRKTVPGTRITYGNITKVDREMLGLPKSHANDAAAIAKHRTIVADEDYRLLDAEYTTLYKQMRKKKRSLHEANPRKGRKEPNRTAKRNCKNVKQVGAVCLLDKIQYNGETGVVTGFSNSGCRAVKEDGTYLGANEKYRSPVLPVKKVKVLYHNNNWIQHCLYPERNSSTP